MEEEGGERNIRIFRRRYCDSSPHSEKAQVAAGGGRTIQRWESEIGRVPSLFSSFSGSCSIVFLTLPQIFIRPFFPKPEKGGKRRWRR